MAHYFENDGQLKSEEKKIKTTINNHVFTFWTDHNVFSKNGLDFGTRTLLESIDMANINGRVLDFGCGYGPIGVYLAKHNLDVDMLDVNERALNLARKNAVINDVNVNIFESYLYEKVTGKYDYIISNPPIRVGKKILYDILFGAKNYLVAGGHLILVIHKDQGAKSLVKDLEKSYQVKILQKNKGFYVIDCENR
jgi:16S rRNA (guanine1207-N2)-methyltransferase